ncbi:MAG: hypothetical protein GY913_05925 [Proteobacteria bacterium]|nr:hypothetical protein [Pseudomonadota bacterium]MCP4916443.1 hypothetical protein [Pseudomonadota bacterium]
MCCFSGPVASVSSTRIFGRRSVPGRQLLAYEMTVAAVRDVAMILPLPTPVASPEDAVRFIDLSGYTELFKHIERGFPVPKAAREPLARGLAPQSAPAPLVVHSVGKFEASFVPRQADFSRLDPRFRIAPELWAKAPQYDDWGFAVFQLADLSSGVSVHPMAFEFPSRDDRVFLPTFHIHGDEVPLEADFDHVLYAQRRVAPRGWMPSGQDAREFVDVARCAHLVDGNRPMYRREVLGTHANRDLWV